MSEIPSPPQPIDPGVPPAPAPVEPAVLALMLQVLWSPARAFESVVRKPRILAPLLALVLLGTASSLIVYKPVIIPFQQEKMSDNPRVTPEIREQTRKAMEGPIGITIAAVIGVVLQGLLPPLVWAGMLYFVFTLLLSGRADFKAVYSVSLFASIVQFPHTLVRVPLMLAKAANGSFDPAVTLGPAALLDKPDPVTIWYGMLMSLDLFSFWAWAVAGVGLAILYRRPGGKIWGPLAALFCVQVLVVGYLATLGGRS